jgi:hypothetical protein
MEGPVLTWVANHRRHHKYSDRDGDPHSPWRFGADWKALAKGLAYAHMGWFFDRNQTSRQRFCPDLLADRGIRRVSQAFPLLTAASLLQPPLAGGLTAFFWASLVRIALLQHATWSINRPHLRQARSPEGAARQQRTVDLGPRKTTTCFRCAMAGRRKARSQADRIGRQNACSVGKARIGVRVVKVGERC